jgi:hypothetical protein
VRSHPLELAVHPFDGDRKRCAIAAVPGLQQGGEICAMGGRSMGLFDAHAHTVE